MERADFLDRLRARLAAGGGHVNLAHPLPPPIDGPLPLPGYPPAPEGDLVAQLCEVADLKGWHVRDCRPGGGGGDDGREQEPRGGLAAALADIVERHGVRRAVCSADPEVAGAAELLSKLGVELVAFEGPTSAAGADLGVTGTAYAIAATATVALSAGRAGGRSAALVPPVHLALVSSANVVATPADLWRHLPARFPDGLPSQLVFASGPSRSADIEFTLTVGVHGPRSAWMAVL